MAPDDMRPAMTQRLRTGGSPRLLQRYESLVQISRRMLEAAREDDWMQIARLEVRRDQLIGELKAALKLEALSATEQRQRIAYLRSILAHDAEIRVRAEPWLAQLEKMVPSLLVTIGAASVTRAHGADAE